MHRRAKRIRARSIRRGCRAFRSKHGVVSSRLRSASMDWFGRSRLIGPRWSHRTCPFRPSKMSSRPLSRTRRCPPPAISPPYRPMQRRLGEPRAALRSRPLAASLDHPRPRKSGKDVVTSSQHADRETRTEHAGAGCCWHRIRGCARRSGGDRGPGRPDRRPKRPIGPAPAMRPPNDRSGLTGSESRPASGQAQSTGLQRRSRRFRRSRRKWLSAGRGEGGQGCEK